MENLFGSRDRQNTLPESSAILSGPISSVDLFTALLTLSTDIRLIKQQLIRYIEQQDRQEKLYLARGYEEKKQQ